MRIHSSGKWLGAALTAIAAGSAVAQTPADLCSNAPTISLAGSYAGTTVGMGGEGNGPIACGSQTAGDVWIRFVSPATGQIRFDTCSPQTTFDTTIAIRSACPGTGSQLACNDDPPASFCPDNLTSSRAIANLSQGQVVFVRVGSALNNVSGTFVLNISAPPPPPPPTLGPDVIVFRLTDVGRFGTGMSNGVPVTAYAVGTESCNRGDVPVSWYDTTPGRQNEHPVIPQNMYRLKSYGQYSRFEPMGQSWVKHGFLSVNGNACGTCQQPPDGGDQLGVNCSDPYGSGLNGSQGNQGPRSDINATTGFYPVPWHVNNGTGDNTVRQRLQVPTADVTGQPAGTRFFVEAQYVTRDDASVLRMGQTVAINALNNASWQEINIQNGTGTPSFIGNVREQQPAIFAWRAADPSVTIVPAEYLAPHPDGDPTHFIQVRFWVAARVTDLGGGQWRYEYAVFNLNSDRSAGSFSVPFPGEATEASYTFRHPMNHSGEPYANAPWTMVKADSKLTFSTQDFATNANANAIRWSTLYNFGFTANVPPTTGTGHINLFKPGPEDPVIAVPNLPVPTLPDPCLADFNADGEVNADDLGDFINCYFSIPPCDGADFNVDGDVNADDLGDFINTYFAGC
ncbi:MAG: hypothetical protein AB7K52_13630 [Phycisphaerales bacterium]